MRLRFISELAEGRPRAMALETLELTVAAGDVIAWPRWVLESRTSDGSNTWDDPDDIIAITEPEAGSDAGSLIDSGVICKGKWNGKTITGIRLNWDKRYITLAPVATVIA